MPGRCVSGLRSCCPRARYGTDCASSRRTIPATTCAICSFGAEGTLGVITAAVIKLFPKPRGHQVAFAGLNSAENALAFFKLAQEVCGNALTGFELMVRLGVEFTVRHIPDVRDPLGAAYPWYVLVDISTMDSEDSATRMMETLLARAFELGLVLDAAIAASTAQARAFWHLRESMSEAQKPRGRLDQARCLGTGCRTFRPSWPRRVLPSRPSFPGVRICAFGHLGDGNIHYNISQPAGADKQAFVAKWGAVNAIVHDIVRRFNGSISAEHGIGQLKRDELAATRSPIEIELMRRIKQSFDPAGIMNPDKVLKLP